MVSMFPCTKRLSIDMLGKIRFRSSSQEVERASLTRLESSKNSFVFPFSIGNIKTIKGDFVLFSLIERA